jgi:hypothetical protein
MKTLFARCLAFAVVAAPVALLTFTVGALAYAASASAKTDDDGSYRVVRRLGFTDAKIVGRHAGQTAAWQSGCSEDDTSAVEMHARDAAGVTHAMVVCCGGVGNNVGCSVRAP